MQKINQAHLKQLPYLQITDGLDNMPEKIYYIGILPTKRQPSVAIVGSRKPTSYGREVTANLASQLARRGVVIVSGLALGIDSIAHEAALEAGGSTIAVQANGLHRIYPSANRRLAESIIEKGGAIISEYEPGVEPMQYRFLQRNRIVSAIADIVLITEAAARSGSLNTAGYALTQGKELCVVPGNITSQMSSGCNHLLRQGATPITKLDDILELLVLSNQTEQSNPLPIGATPIEQQIIEALARGERDGDVILSSLHATPADFNTALTMLELNGVIKALGMNRWTLV